MVNFHLFLHDQKSKSKHKQTNTYLHVLLKYSIIIINANGKFSNF